MPITEEQEKTRQSWQYKTVELLRGNQTLLGSVLLAILGKAPSNPPRIISAGVITAEGILITAFEARAQRGVALTVELGPVEQVRDLYRSICDQLKLPDADRIEFFNEMRKWISRDYRVVSLLPDVPTTRH